MIVWKIDKNEIKYIPQNLQDKKQQNIFLDKYLLVSYHSFIFFAELMVHHYIHNLDF